MISVREAQEKIEAVAKQLEWGHRLSLDSALGRVLGEPIVADRDSPPFDKSIVDGFALDSASVNSAGTSAAPLRVLEVLTAGKTPQKSVTPGAAIQIMTGAPIPPGADAVVMIERCEVFENGAERQVRIGQPNIKPGQNILRRGQSMRAGEVILRAGAVLRGIELGLLAEVGRTEIITVRRPSVAIVSTGDELVPPEETPGPGQIRNSNQALLSGLVMSAGGNPLELGIARDDPEQLQSVLSEGIDCELLVVSGGVSAGALDLIPQTLVRLGVTEVFHKVSLKPGKPVWFGYIDHPAREDQPAQRTLVFGLPGNPVSSLVCFLLFVAPAIRLILGHPTPHPTQTRAVLKQPFQHRGDRPTYWPALLDESIYPLAVSTLPWQGSGDLRTLSLANALVHFPAGDQEYPAGAEVAVLRI